MKRVVVICLLLVLFFLPVKTLKVKAEEAEGKNIVVNVLVGGKKYTYIKKDNLYKGKNFVIKHNEYLREKQLKNMGNKSVITHLLSLNKSEEYIISYLLPNFEEFLLNIKRENDILPIDAKVEFDTGSGEFVYTSDSVGNVIDNKAINLSLLNELSSENECVSLKAEFVKKRADISLYDVKQRTKLRSRESTSYASSEEGRRHNLIKAMSAFNGLVVLPGQKVSFNNIVGELSYSAGYKDAMVILNGEFVKGLGGGVCQASTTIYNAALMAGLEICEVHRHSLPVYYVPAGFDAMVSEYSDMVFKNNTNHPVYFKTYTRNERVYAEVYGENMKGVSYKKVSAKVKDIETTEDIIKKDVEGKYADKVTYKGEFFRVRSPRKGFEVNAYLQKYEDGKLISEKLIRNEVYAAQKGVVYEGVKENNEGESLTEQAKAES